MGIEKYTAILCDDENSTLDFLIESIDWKSLNIQIIGTANNGKDAINLILEKQADIVLLDIKMPIKNGLEVLEYVSRYKLETNFIILSGYDDFAYAKQAMKYGVQYYLLKPLNEMELLEALYTITRRTGEEHDQAEAIDVRERILSIALESFIHGRRTSVDDIESILKNFNLPLRNEPSAVAVFSFDDDRIEDVDSTTSLLLSNQISSQSVSFRFENEKIVFIQNTINEDLFINVERFANLLLSELGLKSTCGIGVEVNDLSQCNFSYSKALQALSYRFYQPDRRIFSFQDICNIAPLEHDVDTYIEDMLSAILTHGTNIDSILENFLSSILYVEMPPPNYVMSVCHLFLESVRKSILEASDFDIWKFIEKNALLKVKSFNDLKITMLEIFNKARLIYETIFLLDEYSEMKMISQAENDEVILDTLSLLNKDINQSIENLASHIHFSPAYFAIYFKNKTSVNLSDYIFDKKMRLARIRLLHSQYSIFEISEMLGYNDYRSFSRAFKKFHSLSPTQFQEMYSTEKSE